MEEEEEEEGEEELAEWFFVESSVVVIYVFHAFLPYSDKQRHQDSDFRAKQHVGIIAEESSSVF